MKCKKCKNKYDKSKFEYRSKDGVIHHRTWCKQCIFEYRLKYKYNSNLEDYNNILKSQDYKCATCKQGDTKLVISYCQAKDQIRGLLCNKCNMLLGIINKDRDLVKKLLLFGYGGAET